jgi:malonyl-CoA/methylmalonyl-CoA synthetase
MGEMAAHARGALPNEPIFARLVRMACEVKHVIIDDPGSGVQCDFARLLSDIHQMHCALRQSLSKSLFRADCSLLLESNPYILILSPGNYEFVVAALSVLSIGGAFAPVGEFA